MDKPVLVFGGTSEGRKLAELFDSNNRKCTVCVATEYGEQLLNESENITIICGRMDSDGICRLMTEYADSGRPFSCVVDATHPYASLISANVKQACTRTNTAYLRLLRGNIYNSQDNNIKFFQDASQAAEYLDKTTGSILLATGSKDLPVFCDRINDKNRIIARVLPSVAAIEACNNLGLHGKQIIAMQGPFSKETNIALIRQADAKFIVMKESGSAGGFPEKVSAAKETGTDIIIIKRPLDETGYTYNEIVKILGLEDDSINNCNDNLYKEIVLAGMGMGNKGTFTIDGLEVLEGAELVIGTGRLLETAGSIADMSYKEIYNAYDAGLIYKYIKEHPKYKKIVVLLSGDTGFYSGAKKLEELLSGLKEYNIKIIPGISSIVYFASRLKISWQDIKLLSLHGRTQNVVDAIKRNIRTFVLLGAENSVAWLARLCIQYGLEDVKLYIGHNFGYNDEEIISGSPLDFTGYIDKGFLYCAIIENPSAGRSIVTHGIPDSQFIRGNVPMTKEEIRAVSVSKLQLLKDAVVYDIGAGTGSVAVECARMAHNGKVYAIEKNSEAVKLIEQNKLLHAAFNLEVVNGTAPGVLEGLEPPTHVFIGGSSGKLRQVIYSVFAKNRNARIVINAVTLETVAEVQGIIKENKNIQTDISCVTVSKARALGNYHIMQALNPVWIIVIELI
ncbi:MAG: precorrin-6A reductase [Lachnospiraceae bacterium]|nr:precorrin-6A reductase [Lachnospiraceae bacterium]